MAGHDSFCCSDCGVLNCYRQEKKFPAQCVGENIPQEQMNRVKDLYINDPFVAKMSNAAAEIEGTYYGRLTRVEETIAFARRIGAERIGIATCIGLMNETRALVKILDAHEIKSYCAICKVGSIDKTEVGIPEELKVQPGCYESICNPVMQAEILNREQTGLNVIMGLCVGHDSLFIKYSQAPVTVLVVKDRVLAHNPVGALNGIGFYYKKLLDNQDI
ncbi:MAG: DUF1847 domain-containing protein [Syntrophomonadaceae bacterium]|jgi:uncharacterized metal-binding protein|nr:DUF1847 domain-containing protein [Syntrophomonadaceae bacterium]